MAFNIHWVQMRLSIFDRHNLCSHASVWMYRPSAEMDCISEMNHNLWAVQNDRRCARARVHSIPFISIIYYVCSCIIFFLQHRNMGIGNPLEWSWKLATSCKEEFLEFYRKLDVSKDSWIRKFMKKLDILIEMYIV